MAVEVSTQCRENYGAHDWDGNGECPQYWKNKGGEDWIILNAPSEEDAVHYVDHYVCHSNDYSQEYVVSHSEVDDNFRTEMEVISDGECSAMRIEWADRFDNQIHGPE